MITNLQPVNGQSNLDLSLQCNGGLDNLVIFLEQNNCKGVIIPNKTTYIQDSTLMENLNFAGIKYKTQYKFSYPTATIPVPIITLDSYDTDSALFYVDVSAIQQCLGYEWFVSTVNSTPIGSGNFTDKKNGGEAINVTDLNSTTTYYFFIRTVDQNGLKSNFTTTNFTTT